VNAAAVPCTGRSGLQNDPERSAEGPAAPRRQAPIALPFLEGKTPINFSGSRIGPRAQTCSGFPSPYSPLAGGLACQEPAAQQQQRAELLHAARPQRWREPGVQHSTRSPLLQPALPASAPRSCSPCHQHLHPAPAAHAAGIRTPLLQPAPPAAGLGRGNVAVLRACCVQPRTRAPQPLSLPVCGPYQA